MCCKASVALISPSRGQRTVSIDENFFTGYRETVFERDEIIVGIWIPFSNKVIKSLALFLAVFWVDVFCRILQLTNKFFREKLQNQFVRAYKQSQRRDDDIAIVVGAFNVQIDPETRFVKEALLSYGGMASTTKMALRTASLILDR